MISSSERDRDVSGGSKRGQEVEVVELSPLVRAVVHARIERQGATVVTMATMARRVKEAALLEEIEERMRNKKEFIRTRVQ